MRDTRRSDGVTRTDGNNILFRARGLPDLPGPVAPEGYRFEIWEPSMLSVLPPGVPRGRYAIWWLFDQAHVFDSRLYSVVLVWHDEKLAHRLGIFPGWFRFPFMEPSDLQFGDLWTAPDHRGRRLAAYALRLGMRVRSRAALKTFWYLTHEDNVASIRTAERAGFERFGTATRTRRWGLRQFGRFELTGRAQPG